MTVSELECSSLVGLLQQCDQRDLFEVSDSEVSADLGRFRISAGNIGVCQQFELESLFDHRLRDAPEVAAHIVEIPNELTKSLEDDMISMLSH